MKEQVKKTAKEIKKQNHIPGVSLVMRDGAIVETVYWREEARTAFVLWQGGAWRYESSVTVTPRQRLIPYSPNNNLIKNEVVIFPSEPLEYNSDAELLSEIQSFIHTYVDVSPLFEKIATYYVLFSWVFDSYSELPYLRLRGDPGSGKTRFLLTVGSLCYKPIFASGASTVSPLFRIIDIFRGTLIIDEGDFRLSDERAEIVKILNNGNARGFPVLRSESTSNREFDPRAFAVFGPKLIATRGFFQDRALESRCITEEMGQGRLRDDVPINLPPTYKDEALCLRNKLLLFRFRNLHKQSALESLVDRSIEPRLNQIFVPLLSVIEDEQARNDIRQLARQYNREMIAERGMDTEAQILGIIRDLLASGEGTPSVKDITNWFMDKHGAEYERRVTAKWVGGIIRKRLNLKTQKSHGIYVIPPSEQVKLNRLYEKYGMSTDEVSESETEKQLF